MELFYAIHGEVINFLLLDIKYIRCGYAMYTGVSKKNGKKVWDGMLYPILHTLMGRLGSTFRVIN